LGLLINAENFLPFQNASDLLEGGLDITFWETNLAEALDIAELFAAFFEQDYRLGEAQPSLKKSGLVYNVHACLHGHKGTLANSCEESIAVSRSWVG
jgi:hypothetical protein